MAQHGIERIAMPLDVFAAELAARNVRRRPDVRDWAEGGRAARASPSP